MYFILWSLSDFMQISYLWGDYLNQVLSKVGSLVMSIISCIFHSLDRGCPSYPVHISIININTVSIRTRGFLVILPNAPQDNKPS